MQARSRVPSGARRNRRVSRLLWRAAVIAGAMAFSVCAYVYLTLPDVRDLATRNPSTTAFIELRKREAAAEGRTLVVRQRWVPYGQMASSLRRAVLVAEDAAFFEHDGVDLRELRASLEANWEDGRFTRGASTITQQLAKNLYLSPSRNPLRKLKELLITRRLEAALTKRRILEIYLNVIEWGDGIFGAEAATRRYFGKSAAAVSAEEAALLAGAIINPREHSPGHPTVRLRRRQQIIARRMGVTSGTRETPRDSQLGQPTPAAETPQFRDELEKSSTNQSSPQPLPPAQSLQPSPTNGAAPPFFTKTPQGSR